MPTLTPEFDEYEIRDDFDYGAWSRGRAYARYGHIIDGRIEGDTLYADCVGSQPYPYRVRATWRNGRLSAHCTCPIGALGDCKHVVALLLTWIEHPQDFVLGAEIDDLLTQASPDRLRETLAGVIEHSPELLQLVSQYLQGPERWSAEMVRREISRVMTHAVEQGWQEFWDTWHRALPQQVSVWLKRVEQCRTAAQYESLIELTEGLFEALGPFIDVRDDAVLFCLQDVVEALIDLLAPYRPSDIRQRVATQLANIALMQGSARRLVLSKMARSALVEHLDHKERRRLAREIKRTIYSPYQTGWRPPFHMHEAGLYYALIDAETLSTTTRLQHARDLNDPIMAIDMMLELGYKSKQFELLVHAEPSNVQQFLEPFERHGRLNEALDWMVEHGIGATGYRSWLEGILKRHGRWEALLHIAWKSIRDETYLDGDGKPRIDGLRKAALEANLWNQERARLITFYKERDAWQRIVRIYLDDEMWDEALEALDRVTQEMVYYPLPAYREEIAASLETIRPMAACLIYAENVELYIGHRTRAYYRRAAELMVRMQACHERAHKIERWGIYLADLRDEFANLAALDDELRKVGL